MRIKTTSQFAPISLQGFTLLELLLVITLLTTLTVAGMGWYQIKMRNFKVDKTALQMQQWLQAGLAFYLDCQQWPKDSTIDTNMMSAMMGESSYTHDECPALQNKVRMYMPQGSDINGPWSYVDENGNLIHSGYVIAPLKNPDGSDSNVFSVKTVVGYNENNTNNILLSSAQMIAGRLPNASVNQDNSNNNNAVSVLAYVNTQGGGNTNTQSFIVDMQNISSHDTSRIKTQYTCPNGFQYEVFNALAAFKGWGGSGKQPIFQEVVDMQQSNGVYKPVATTIGAYLSRDNDDGNNKLLLIGACMPIQKNSANDKLNNGVKESKHTEIRY